MKMKRTQIVIAVIALVIAACGGGDAATTAAPAATATTEGAVTTAGPETTAAPATTAGATTTEAMVEGEALLVASTDLGEIITDPEGATLYIFTPDEQGDPTCFDDCAANWPPLTTELAAGEGLDTSLLALADRGDGTMQVTYNGWPLYYFAADAAPGDINGQGIGDIWWVIGPDGEPITG
jgi:predicted lipoprotein with Yx(FWY)xxD motif